VRKREYALRAATVATDVGYRLRNSAQWDKEDKQYKEQIAAKQKEVDAAKQKLDELQSDARKAGVPTKLRE
jgi:Skp family chaperone for outer membrane proteins